MFWRLIYLTLIPFHIIQTPTKTNHEIKTSIFTCFFHEIKTNIFTCFFDINIKIADEQSFFCQFHEHIFRSSRSQMFFKIGASKDFAIFWIKRDSNIGVFLWIWICIFSNNCFFIEHIQWLLLYFLKVIKQTVILQM